MADKNEWQEIAKALEEKLKELKGKQTPQEEEEMLLNYVKEKLDNAPKIEKDLRQLVGEYADAPDDELPSIEERKILVRRIRKDKSFGKDADPVGFILGRIMEIEIEEAEEIEGTLEAMKTLEGVALLSDERIECAYSFYELGETAERGEMLAALYRSEHFKGNVPEKLKFLLYD